MKVIKTKQSQKDIKMLDKAMDVSYRVKNAYIRTKEQSEQLGNKDAGNYVEYAGNNVREGVETIIRKGGHTTENYSKKVAGKINNHRVPDADAPPPGTQNKESSRQISKSEAKETVYKNAAQAEAKQADDRSFTPVKTKEAAKQKVSQPGVKNVAKQNVVQSKVKETVRRKFILSKPNELAKHRFIQSRAKQRFSQTIKIRMANKNAVQTQARQTSRYIVAQTSQHLLFQAAEKTAAQTIHTSSKTGHTIKQSVMIGDKAIEGASRGAVKTVKRSVKTAENTTKTVVKTSQAVAKTAVKTAQTAQRTVQAARAAARAAVVSAKTAVKAMVATIKVSIVAVKGIIYLIAAGGWIAVVIILVICLAGLLLGSGFGVFLSNESSGENMPTMTEVARQLNEEFAAKIEQIKVENPHDTLDLSDNVSSTIVSNWREILPVYVVKVAVDPEYSMEVATLDDTKKGILRGIFWDMNQINYWIETIEHEKTVATTDEDGNETEETVTTTETILHINVTSNTHVDMIAEYSFNSDQVEMLHVLMQDEYQQLFMQLTGS